MQELSVNKELVPKVRSMSLDLLLWPADINYHAHGWTDAFWKKELARAVTKSLFSVQEVADAVEAKKRWVKPVAGELDVALLVRGSVLVEALPLSWA
jgi:hypothetical protein